MQNWLTNATKTRIIRELKKMMFDHPRYREDAENIQNKYSYEERPQRGVIINGVSADRVRLSADNYMGRLTSFVMLTEIGDFPGTSVEWVKENLSYLEQFSKDRSVFPTQPGVYVFEIDSLPDEGKGIPGQFYVKPYITVNDELVITFETRNDQTAQIQNNNIYPNSLRLWFDGKRPLLNDVDYSVDYSTGEIKFLKNTTPDSTIYADYRYEIERIGPFSYTRNSSNEEVIPGAVFAFGDRIWKDDQFSIVVTPDRTETAEVYGGKFEVSLELTVFSRDADDREKLSDYLVMKILESQNRLGFEGIELLDVSPGGESEEVYSNELDDYWYDGTINLSYRVDWQILVPLPIEIFRIETTSKKQEEKTGYMDGTYTSDLIKPISPSEIYSMKAIIGKEITYERMT